MTPVNFITLEHRKGIKRNLYIWRDMKKNRYQEFNPKSMLNYLKNILSSLKAYPK